MNTTVEAVETAKRELNVTLGTLQRSDTRIAVGLIDVGTLIPNYAIVRRNHYSREGYQREPSTTRVNQLASALEKGRVDLPTAVLLNLRAFDASRHLKNAVGGTMFVPDGDPLYVVDGQHRVEALKKLFDDDPKRWADFQLPFVCMLGANELEEMDQFYIVNSNAKSVQTALAFDLLKQRAESNPDLMVELQESGKAWIVVAQGLAERVSKSSNWQGRIRFPREPKATTTIPNSGFANSVKQLLSSSYFGGITTDNQVEILEAYWDGIRRVLPQAFVDPVDYVIQKSLGVHVMHQLLPTIIEIVRSRNGSVLDPEEYKEVLTDPLLQLQGESQDGLVEGTQFWHTAPEGVAGSFSSSAGRRILITRLKAKLPKIEVR